MKEKNNIAPINENLNEPIYEVEEIKQKIYFIRGKQVMLDSDVAKQYHYETKNLNKAMKRNIERFPEDFCFQLTEEEIGNLRFQIGTSSLENKNYGGRRYLPYVYTEQGISMLAGILKNEIAIHVSINIIRAFIEMKKILGNNQLLFDRINNIELNQLEFQKTTNDKFETIFKYIEDKDIKIKQPIFYDGQIWDAYNLIIKIIKQAEKKIIIIDNYIDDSILEMLAKKKKNVEVIIFTSNNSQISKLDIEKFNREYPILKLIKTNKFHDRFIAIDNRILYHSGASLKDLGKKCFAITKMEDIEFIEKIEEKYLQKNIS